MLNIILGILGLSLIVFIHELGHFWVARLCKIRVEAFSVGLGPVIFKRTSSKGTEFRLSLIPLGGYCKMEDENTGLNKIEQSTEDSVGKKSLEVEDSKTTNFKQAHPMRKILVVLAGPFINVVFCYVLFVFAFSIFTQTKSEIPPKLIVPSIADFDSIYDGLEDTPAKIAGLKTGDIILQIDNNAVGNFDDLRNAVALSGSTDISVMYLRDEIRYNGILHPYLNKETGLGTIGVYPWIDIEIGAVSDGGWAEGVGLKMGDVISALNDKVVDTTYDFSEMSKTLEPGAPLRLTLNDGTIIDDFVPQEWGLYFNTPVSIIPPLNLGQALAAAYHESLGVLKLNIKSFAILFRGVKLQNVVSGPIRIIQQTGEITQQSIARGQGFSLISFLALLSVALGITNLLPIPVLDGGQFILYLIELIKRKPVSDKAIEIYQKIGVAFMLTLFIFVMFADISSFFS